MIALAIPARNEIRQIEGRGGGGGEGVNLSCSVFDRRVNAEKQKEKD